MRLDYSNSVGDKMYQSYDIKEQPSNKVDSEVCVTPHITLHSGPTEK